MSNLSKDLNSNLTYPKSKMLNEIRTVTITDKGQIVIPKSLRQKKGFKTGDKIVVLSRGNRLELVPLSFVSNSMETAYASEKVLAKDWNSKEDDLAWKKL